MIGDENGFSAGCQSSTTLQKAEEVAKPSKITLQTRPFFNIHGSPFNLLAPTPANTPQVPNFSLASNDVLPSVALSPVTEKFLVTEMMLDQMNQETAESENEITRSLLLDFSEKSGSTDCSSVITCQGTTLSAGTESSIKKTRTDGDDGASVWSIQANASSTRDDDKEEEEGECVEEYYYDEYKEEEDYYDDKGLYLDELCEGMNKMNVVGGSITDFKGKHIRFVYNSDGEIQGEEQVDERDSSSPKKQVRKELTEQCSNLLCFSSWL